MTTSPPRKQQIIPPNTPISDDAWASKASRVNNPVGAGLFGISARASMKSMQVAMQHAKVFGQLMEVATETIAKMHRAEDLARETAVRQELSQQLHLNETARQLDQLVEDQHQRALAGKRRTREQVNSDTETLLAEQNQRAKEKFEPLKHAIGEERLKAEAARRKVGAAEAYAAMAEAGHPPEEPVQAEADSPKPPVRAVLVSEWLEDIRRQLRELRADDADPEKRARLVAEEEIFERMLADLLKGK